MLHVFLYYNHGITKVGLQYLESARNYKGSFGIPVLHTYYGSLGKLDWILVDRKRTVSLMCYANEIFISIKAFW